MKRTKPVPRFLSPGYRAFRTRRDGAPAMRRLKAQINRIVDASFAAHSGISAETTAALRSAIAGPPAVEGAP